MFLGDFFEELVSHWLPAFFSILLAFIEWRCVRSQGERMVQKERLLRDESNYYLQISWSEVLESKFIIKR